MIGDNYRKDILGAKKAGFKTIFFNIKGLTGSYEKADVVIRHMEELGAAIDEL